MNLLDSVRDAISILYRESLKIELVESQDDSNLIRWSNVSNKDFLQTGDNAGLLLDSEIGLALFVLEHHPENDLNTEIRQALKISDKFQPAYLPTKSDINGPWQVGLLWLVKDELADNWKAAISERRKQSGFSEEIALNVVFYNSLDGVQDAILKNLLPQLLLQTRKLFRMNHDSMSLWHSANGEVADMLRTFSMQFKNPIEVEIAAKIVEQAFAEPLTSEAEPYPESPNSIQHLSVKNFRNIESCELWLRSPLDENKVVPKVVFGPNGTGKTAIFEALSLALCGTSLRNQEYLKDSDLISRKPYSESVLRPLKSGATNPEVILDGKKWTPPTDQIEVVNKQLQAMEGTLLEQEDSQQFARLDRKILAARVLRGYSTLADIAQQKAEFGYQQEHARRQAILVEYGLNLAIRKIETLRERVLEKVLSKELIYPSPSLLVWLNRMGGLLEVQGRNWLHLYASWKYWTDENVKNSFSEFVRSGDSKALASSLFTRINRRRQLTEETQKALDRIKAQVGSLSDIDLVITDIGIWSTWLITQSEAAELPNTVQEIAELGILISREQQIRDKLAVQGKALRGRQEHLQRTKQFLQDWAITHPAECPTCAADHTDQGGILKITLEVNDVNDKQLEELREQYTLVNTNIKKIETHLVKLGQAECPLSMERREIITELLRDVLYTDITMESWLKDPLEQQRVFDVLKNLQVLPILPPLSDNDDADIERIAQQVLSRIADANLVWEAPEHWQAVKKVLDTSCMKIVQAHMPKTLQAVWSELLCALTPARWNLVVEPKFDFKLSRGNNEMRVVAEKHDRQILARYLFNQAEVHLLGLAWFFMRYFSHGRLRFSLIAMDDPAQEMDQTTYRTFTRFLQTLTRLHSHHKRQFSILLFLHQEDRALDAARSMNALLYVLGWEKEQNECEGQKHVLSEVRLSTEQFQPISALDLFKKTEARVMS